jgi:NitT/TauT family transport system substrate-binding protein
MRNASSISPTTQQKGLGAFDMAVIQKGANAYKSFGLVQRNIKVTDVINQDLLPGKK